MGDHRLNFTRIEGPEWSAREVVICGQGPSWKMVHHPDIKRAKEEGARVIAVNGAVDEIPDLADYFFTLDHSTENLRRIADPYPGVTYVQAVPEDYTGPAPEHVVHLRRISVAGEPDGRPFRDRVWEQIPGGLSEARTCIHTGNSGFGALNLAVHMGARRVVLLGVDGHGRERWDGSENGYLGHLPRLFRTAVPQLEWRGVEVVNGSPLTQVGCFPIKSPEDALHWLTH